MRSKRRSLCLAEKKRSPTLTGFSIDRRQWGRGGMSQTSALAVQPPAEIARELRCVCIDIETPGTGAALLHKLAAFRPDTGERALFQGQFRSDDVRAALESLA